MKRRDFINRTIVGGTSALLLPSFLSGCGEDEGDDDGFDPRAAEKKIVIIGAGIAGLAAASQLKKKGYQVVVIESQDRVGGRLRTDRSLGVAFDEGASWIHGPKDNPISDLANEVGSERFTTDDEDLLVYQENGAVYSEGAEEDAYEAYEEALEKVEDAGSADRSFLTVFNELYPGKIDENLWKYMLSAYLEFDTGSDVAELSSHQFYDDEAYSGRDVIIVDGFDRIAGYLAQELTVNLNEKVTEIDYSEEKVMITTDASAYDADYVLVTVPLGVLKKEIISFTPALPDSKVQAISRVKMGAINKFLLTWDTAFWDDVQYIGYTPDTRGKFNYFLNVKKFTNVNALMTFTFGNYSIEAESMSDEQVISEIMGHLKSIYGDSIPDPVNLLRTKWNQNEHTYGSYSFATSGTTTDDFDTLAIGVSNRLFFAGEHTSRDYRGTVHGAYLSGIREATKISALL